MLFRHIHHQTGLTVVMVTHTTQLMGYGTRALELAGGRLVCDTAT